MLGISLNAVFFAASYFAYYQNCIYLKSIHIFGESAVVLATKANVNNYMAVRALFMCMLIANILLFLWVTLGITYIRYLKRWDYQNRIENVDDQI
jgi:hypothetical protein